MTAAGFTNILPDLYLTHHCQVQLVCERGAVRRRTMPCGAVASFSLQHGENDETWRAAPRGALKNGRRTVCRLVGRWRRRLRMIDSSTQLVQLLQAATQRLLNVEVGRLRQNLPNAQAMIVCLQPCSSKHPLMSVYNRQHKTARRRNFLRDGGDSNYHFQQLWWLSPPPFRPSILCRLRLSCICFCLSTISHLSTAEL